MLSLIGVAAAVILYFVAQKFKVIEDPRIDLIAEVLPGANCGGCGFAGCRGLAEAFLKTDNIENLKCPPGGAKAAAAIAKILGKEIASGEPMVAVVRCSGSKTNAPQKNAYDAAKSCFVANSLFAGESGCPNGCLGLGDCVEACKFDAIFIDENTGLPVVSDENCVACGACVKACPRGIIEMRAKGKNNRRIFVSCVNIEKGAPAKKNCAVACIGCGKCVKVCPHDAIVLKNNLAYIDYQKCKLCRKCTTECPTGAILEINFPPRKDKSAEIVADTTENA